MAFDIVAKIEQWRGQLLDTSKRNRLIHFKTGQAGGVALAHPDADRIWATLLADERTMWFARRGDLFDDKRGERPGPMNLGSEEVEAWDQAGPEEMGRCLRSPRLLEDDLLTDLPDKALAARLNRMALAARTSQAEMGVTTLYVAFGLLRWHESPDSQVELRVPLLLVPARLARKNVGARWSLALEDHGVVGNHSLVQLLLEDFDIKLPPVPNELDSDNPRAQLLTGRA